MAEYLQFKRGKLAGLSAADITPGTVYITTDERAMYVDYTDGDVAKRMRLGDYVEYAKLTDLTATASTALSTTAFYFVNEGNMLLRWTGDQSVGHQGFVQINPNTITEITNVGLEVAGDAANNKATIVASVVDSINNAPVKSEAITIEGSAGAKISTPDNKTVKIEVSSISEDTHYTPVYDADVDFTVNDATTSTKVDAATTETVNEKKKVRFVSGVNTDKNGHVVGLGYDTIEDTHATIDTITLTAASNTAADGVVITNNAITSDNAETRVKGTMEIVGEGATTVAAANNGKITISSVDSKVTSVENHYTPANGTAITAVSDGAGLQTSINAITSIKTDAAGHITDAIYSTLEDTHSAPAATTVTVDGDTNKATLGVDVTDTDGAKNAVKNTMSIVGAGAATVSANGTTVTITSTDNSVTDAKHHYTPVFNANATATAGSQVAVDEAVDVVVAVKLDSKGHTTGVETRKFADTHGAVEALSLSAEATGFKSTIIFDGVTTSSAVLDPIVKIGNTNTEVHFVNGAADLDVYTTTEVDELITSRLKAADAMTFKGSLDAGASTETDALKKALPTSNVNAGDTWIVASEGTYGAYEAKVGDLFIALEDLTTSTNANWAYVPAGNDDMPELTGEDNKIQLGFAGAPSQLGSIEVKAADNCGITATVANDVMTIGFEWGTF